MVIGQLAATTESQRSEYGRTGIELDIEQYKSTTVEHEIANFKLDAIFIGSPNPTIFVFSNPACSNVDTTPLGGYDSYTFIYDENFTTTDYLDSSATSATWSTTGSLIY